MAAVTPGQREAQRRREAAGLLMITAATAAYASRQLQNGLTPAEAQMAMVEAAADMAAASGSLRRLARPTLEQRRLIALMWVGAGVSKPEIAARLGVCERTVWRYLGHR